jgi:hypothetical protein
MIMQKDIKETYIRSYLTVRRNFTNIWCIEDVQDLCPELNAEEASDLLNDIEHDFDSENCKTREMLADDADYLFGSNKQEAALCR